MLALLALLTPQASHPDNDADIKVEGLDAPVTITTLPSNDMAAA